MNSTLKVFFPAVLETYDWTVVQKIRTCYTSYLLPKKNISPKLDDLETINIYFFLTFSVDWDLGSSLGRCFSLGFSPGFSVKLSTGAVRMGRCGWGCGNHSQDGSWLHSELMIQETKEEAIMPFMTQPWKPHPPAMLYSVGHMTSHGSVWEDTTHSTNIRKGMPLGHLAS